MKTYSHKARQTGTKILIISAVDAQLDAGTKDFPTRWYTICEDHANAAGHPTCDMARAWASTPDAWCEECRATCENDPTYEGGKAWLAEKQNTAMEAITFANKDGHPISVNAYADALVNSVREEMKVILVMGKATSWGDLHEYVDANDFIVEACALYFIEWDEQNRDEFFRFANAAVRIAEQLLWPA